MTGGVGKKSRCRAYLDNGGTRSSRVVVVTDIPFGEQEVGVAERMIFYGTA
jgi:hypothetical protein